MVWVWTKQTIREWNNDTLWVLTRRQKGQSYMGQILPASTGIAEWKYGRIEELKDGRMEGWIDGRMEEEKL